MEIALRRIGIMFLSVSKTINCFGNNIFSEAGAANCTDIIDGSSVCDVSRADLVP